MGVQTYLQWIQGRRSPPPSLSSMLYLHCHTAGYLAVVGIAGAAGLRPRCCSHKVSQIRSQFSCVIHIKDIRFCELERIDEDQLCL
jgi:hypothetical protein